jgi:hypothetical protein
MSGVDLERLSPPSREALAKLGNVPICVDFYLAGGAALALRLGHRPARDLDLMSSTCRLQPAERRDLLAELLAAEPGTEVETARDGFLQVRWPDGVALRFYWYPYPLVDPPDVSPRTANVAVASLADLVLMKLGAIASRGGRRDFVDLYFACRELSLERALAGARQKFPYVVDFPLQAMKALADFSDAELEPMPSTSEPVEWPAVRDWAQNQAAAFGRAALDAGDEAPAVDWDGEATRVE